MAKPSPTYADDPVLVALGEAIRRARIGIGLSQEVLAVDAGLDRSYMGGIERGEHNLDEYRENRWRVENITFGAIWFSGFVITSVEQN